MTRQQVVSFSSPTNCDDAERWSLIYKVDFWRNRGAASKRRRPRAVTASFSEAVLPISSDLSSLQYDPALLESPRTEPFDLSAYSSGSPIVGSPVQSSNGSASTLGMSDPIQLPISSFTAGNIAFDSQQAQLAATVDTSSSLLAFQFTLYSGRCVQVHATFAQISSMRYTLFPNSV